FVYFEQRSAVSSSEATIRTRKTFTRPPLAFFLPTTPSPAASTKVSSMICNFWYWVPVCLGAFAPPAIAEDAVDLAAQLIGRPYVWGAEGPNSFDCSGLTQYVYQEVGIALPRRAISQSTSGDPARGALRRGDLLFFSTDTRQSLVTHVGLYEGDGVMIDASKRHGRVRRDNLDDPFWIER